LPEKRRRLLGEHKKSYVIGSIYLDKLNNVSAWGFCLIIHPRILYDKGIIFNNGWIGGEDNSSIIIKKVMTW
jgi:hypothetical protein